MNVRVWDEVQVVDASAEGDPDIEWDAVEVCSLVDESVRLGSALTILMTGLAPRGSIHMALSTITQPMNL